jgi:hypothetical protein
MLKKVFAIIKMIHPGDKRLAQKYQIKKHDTTFQYKEGHYR